MNQVSRELTGRERQRIRKLVTSRCANYDREYGCLLLDCDCYMFGVCHTNSALCRYFREAVLPTDPELEAVFKPMPTQLKACKVCSRKFPADGKRVDCSERCANQARRQQTAVRVRRYRERRKQQ